MRSMTYLSCISDVDKVLTVDASVLINLIASGEAARILRSLPSRIAVSEIAVREISSGLSN